MPVQDKNCSDIYKNVRIKYCRIAIWSGTCQIKLDCTGQPYSARKMSDVQLSVFYLEDNNNSL